MQLESIFFFLNALQQQNTLLPKYFAKKSIARHLTAHVRKIAHEFTETHDNRQRSTFGIRRYIKALITLLKHFLKQTFFIQLLVEQEE